MVVSAILTTALAPITGALFGASYGTAIRIGYEIIFPALFGDVINEQKNNPTKLQEEGTKRTIESMHKMFTGVGGAAAMEFGIEQGIEMAKKKTESPEVQDMIDLSLGLTERQLNKRGKAQQFQDPIKEEDPLDKVKEFKKTGDFQGMSHSEILQIFRDVPLNQIITLRNLLKKWYSGKTNVTTIAVDKIIRERNEKRDTTKEAIEKTDPSRLINKIASMFNRLQSFLRALGFAKKAVKLNRNDENNKRNIQLISKEFLKLAKQYNQFVTENRRSNLQIDTAKSLLANKIIPK